MHVEQWWNDTDTVKPTFSEKKTCAGATLSTTNPIWNYLESNPGLSGKRPVTNRLTRHPVYFLFDKGGFA
jgi:hypothetical protein